MSRSAQYHTLRSIWARRAIALKSSTWYGLGMFVSTPTLSFNSQAPSTCCAAATSLDPGLTPKPRVKLTLHTNAYNALGVTTRVTRSQTTKIMSPLPPSWRKTDSAHRHRLLNSIMPR